MKKNSQNNRLNSNTASLRAGGTDRVTQRKARLGSIWTALVSILGIVVLSSQFASSQCPCEQTTQTLVECWWNSDGDAFWTFIPELYFRALTDTDEFYRMMQKDTAAYEQFLNSLLPAIFTNDYDTAVTELERKKYSDLVTLQQLTTTVNPDLLELHEQLIATIKDIQPTYQEMYFSLSDYHMSSLLQQWRLRNGVPVGKIAPEMLEFAVEYPNVFFEFMWTDTVGFNQWLGSLDKFVFTAAEESQQTKLSELLKADIASLEQSEQEAHYPTMHRRLIETLEAIDSGAAKETKR